MSAASPRFPWQRILNWAVRELHMAPHDVWRSTLRELFPQGSSPPDAPLRQTLFDLMEMWPDEQ
jgi:hypothetical protein